MPEITSPAKMMFRADDKAGLIRCFISMVDESEKFEISAFDMTFANHNKRLYEIWNEAMSQLFRLWSEEVTGMPVVNQYHVKPESRN